MATTLHAKPDTWRVRPLHAADVPAVLQLAQQVNGRAPDAAWYRWKVLGAPGAAAMHTAWVAEADGRIVAHYAATPLRLQIDGQVHAAAHGCDIMTAPAYRRRGVLSSVAAAAQAHWTEAGVRCVIGLPTAAWGGLRERIGCRAGPRLGWLWRPLHPRALRRRGDRTPATGPVPRLSRVLTAPLLTTLPVAAWNRAWDAALRRATGAATAAAAGDFIRVEPVTRAGAAFDDLWARIGPMHRAAVVRDAVWVEYRFAAAPGAGYRILLATRDDVPAGYLVYRLLGSGADVCGWVVDLLAAPADAAARAALLQFAIAEMRRAGARDVRAFAVPGSALDRTFRGGGLVRRRGGYHACIIPLGAGPLLAALDGDTPLHITAGDFDVV